MSNLFCIAVDSGKYYTKSLTFKDGTYIKQKFRTLVQDATNFTGVEIGGESFRVQFDGKQYIIGDMCSEMAMDFNVTKHTFEHRLAIYLSVALMLSKLSSERGGIPVVNLGINVPLNIYRNEHLKTEYANYILNDRRVISLRVNGQAWGFRINELALLPEGVGPIYSNLDRFRNIRATVIDIGSLNASFSLFDRLTPKLDSMLISNLGVNLLRGRIQDSLSTKYGNSLTVDETEVILHEGVYSLNGEIMPDSQQIIKDLMQSHVKEIVNFSKSHGLSLNNPVFCGGGSLMLKDSILAQFPRGLIDENGIFANAMSYWRIMEAKNLIDVEA